MDVNDRLLVTPHIRAGVELLYGLTHNWCMLETTPAKGTLKLSTSCPKVCVVTGKHTLLDTVSDVSQQAFERQDGMETLIS